MLGLPGDHSARLARGELSDPEVAERLEAEDRDGYLRRRDFLTRTAAVAGAVSLASPPARRSAHRRGGSTHPRIASQPAQGPDRHLRGPDDGEPLLRPLLRLAPRRRLSQQGAQLRRRGGPARQDPSAGARLPGMRPPRSRPLLGRWTLPVQPRQDGRLREGQQGGHRQRRVRGRLLREARHSLHPPRCRRLHPVRPLLLLDHGLHLPQPPLPMVRAVRGPEDQRDSRGHAGKPVGDDLRPGARERGLRPLLRLRPAVCRALRTARRPLDAAHRGVLCPGRDRDAPQYLLRRPAVQGWRRGRRHLGRRAPARRHPAGPGIHVRRRARLHGVASVQARRNVRQLRRMGRVLRARRAPIRARLTRQPQAVAELRHDGLSCSRRGGLAVHARRAGQPPDRHPRIDPEANLLPLPARSPEQAPPLRLEHRPHVQLGPAAAPASGPTRPGGGGRDPLLCRRQLGGQRPRQAARPGSHGVVGLPAATRIRGARGALRPHLPRTGQGAEGAARVGSRVKRSAAILSAAVLAVIVAAPSAAMAERAKRPWPPIPERGVSFVHYGEEHWNDLDGLRILPRVVAQAADYRPDAVLMSADKDDDGTVESLTRWKELMRPYNRRGIPYFAAVGNHNRKARPGFPHGVDPMGDLTNYMNVFASRPYPFGDAPPYRDPLLEPRRRPASDPPGASSHYAVETGPVRWIFIDNSCYGIVNCDPLQNPPFPDAAGNQGQYDFLAREAAKATREGDLAFVVMHMPTRDDRPGHTQPTPGPHTMGEGTSPDNVLFEQNAEAAGIDAVFVGHIKGMWQYEARGIPYFTDGGAGGEVYVGPGEETGVDSGYWHGYRLIRVRGGKLRTDAVPVFRRDGIEIDGPHRVEVPPVTWILLGQ